MGFFLGFFCFFSFLTFFLVPPPLPRKKKNTKQWLCPECAKKVLAASGPQTPERSVKSEKGTVRAGKGVVKNEDGGVRGAGDDEAARKAAEQQALRLAALAVLDESSEDNAKVGWVGWVGGWVVGRSGRGIIDTMNTAVSCRVCFVLFYLLL